MLKRGCVNKKLRKEEEQAIGAIYKQYIDIFQEGSDIPRKTFVKSETLYAEHVKDGSEKGQLYNPKPIITYNKKEETNQAKSTNSTSAGLKSSKKKSNLKSLGDELKMLQYERQAKEIKLCQKVESLPTLENDYISSTNLFVSNLRPHVTENDLIKLFGIYGPLASVKIMWPRNDLKSKTQNCGFVAFMCRADAERALENLKNHHDMRISWGKSVKIPKHPVHIPGELYKFYSPPPPSGLPFNAQLVNSTNSDMTALADTVIKVTIPFNRDLLMIIHRTIEFVIKEGPEFESMIIDAETGNSDFNFLTDFQSPAHTYYRWKLYSILNGDPKNSWSMKPFRMYKEGSVWIPPTAPNYREGMPLELLVKNDHVNLSKAQNDRLVHLIQNLTMSRSTIREVTVFCVLHSKSINDIMDVLIDSFKNPKTNITKKLARLYLLSDILYNCKRKHIYIDKFTELNPKFCFDILKQFYTPYIELHHSQDKDCLKIRILKVLRSWFFHGIYTIKFIEKLENVFLYGNEAGGEDDDNSFNDAPLDGANLLKRSFQTATFDCLIVKTQ